MKTIQLMIFGVILCGLSIGHSAEAAGGINANSCSAKAYKKGNKIQKAVADKLWKIGKLAPCQCVKSSQQAKDLLAAFGLKDSIGREVQWEYSELNQDGSPKVDTKGTPIKAFFAIYEDGKKKNLKLDPLYPGVSEKDREIYDVKLCIPGDFYSRPRFEGKVSSGWKSASVWVTPLNSTRVLVSGPNLKGEFVRSSTAARTEYAAASAAQQ